MFKAPSKIIFNQDKKKEWEIHQQKLQNVKCSVDHLNNTQSTLIRFKPRNTYQQLEIQQQNDIHVQRILKIQTSSSMRQLNLNSSISAINHNRTNNNSISAGGNITINKIPPPLGTLHQGFFKKQKRQRDEENQVFFRRIQETKSIFDIKKWAQDAEERKKILLVRSEFPQHYKQNAYHTHNNTIKSHDKTTNAFHHATNSTGIDIIKNTSGIDERNSTKNNNFINHQNNQNNLNNTSSILKDQSLIEINNQSQQQLLNNESISFNEQSSIVGINNQEQPKNNKVISISNITVPANFYHQMQSDTERTNYLKKVIRDSRKILYRKTIEVQDETFFAEIKIEQGLFKIQLENAKGDIYQLEIPENEGTKYFQRECNDDVQELFRKMKLNKQDKTINLLKQKQIVLILPQDTKSNFRLKSLNQTKNFNSTEILSKEEINDNDLEHTEQGQINKKRDKNPNKSLDYKEKIKGQNKIYYSSSSQPIVQLQNKNIQKCSSPSQGRKNQLKNIVEKSQPFQSHEQRNQDKLQNQKKSSQQDKRENQFQTTSQNKQSSKIKVMNSQKTTSNQPHQIQQKQQKKTDNNSVNNKNQKDQFKNNKNVIKEQKKQENNKEEQDDAYEDDYDEFDEEEDIENEKSEKDNKKSQYQNNDVDIDEEYQDPFEKFDEEEEQKKKDEKSPLNQTQNNHHHHEEQNKKMIKFSFNNTGYKKNISQESFNSKQNGNLHHQKSGHSEQTNMKQSNNNQSKNQAAINENNNKLDISQPSGEIEEMNYDEEIQKEESINYDEEFDQDDSGTQYEINDADKEIIEKQKNKEQNNNEEQNINNQQDNNNQEENYEEDFD